jgi:hypothetical protein
MALGGFEIGPPDQRGVAEDPQVRMTAAASLVARPLPANPGEHGRGVAQEGRDGRDGLALSGCVMVALYNRRIYFWSLSDVFFRR